GLVRFYVEGALADEDHKGCLMTNTAVELPADEGARRRVATGLESLETAIMGALVRARAEGELAPDKDPASLARFLVTLLQGVRVVGKTPVRERFLKDTVERALALLD
ncbi:TetR family transcriptional regulator C-terminal domain-containing protein, partial [Streptomyces sp. AC627_RSS907]